MKVFVYWNLHRNLWSIKALEGPQKGRVIDRREVVALMDVVPKVSEKGRERVLRERKKNVHAGLTGHLSNLGPSRPLANDDRVSYNPYKGGNFYYCSEDDLVYNGSGQAFLITNIDKKPEVYVI